jgi:hypothetical protein
MKRLTRLPMLFTEAPVYFITAYPIYADIAEWMLRNVGQ